MNTKNNRWRGFMRIFDGSVYSGSLRSEVSHLLPLEVEFRNSRKSTLAIEQFRRKNFAVFEIGKYVLDQPTADEIFNNPNSTFSPQEVIEVKRDMYLWLIDFLHARGEAELTNSYYFVHVSSKALERAYQRDFGLQRVSRDMSEGLLENENLMFSRGDQLLTR